MENEKKLGDIFEIYTNISFNQNKEFKDTLLFSFRLNITPSVLILILHEIEHQYNIKLSRLEIINGKFNSFNNILEMIKNTQQTII